MRPDVVFAHWPVDTHIDHQLTGVMALRVFLDKESRFALYFFEVMTGRQSLHFRPTHHVDISAYREIKKAAMFAHASQNPAGFWAHHEVMDAFRGKECGCEAAEAFLKAGTAPPDPLAAW